MGQASYFKTSIFNMIYSILKTKESFQEEQEEALKEEDGEEEEVEEEEVEEGVGEEEVGEEEEMGEGLRILLSRQRKKNVLNID